MPTIISHYKFCKIKKIALFLIITFSIILLPNLFLIDHAIQIENDNQIMEEINMTNDNEESFNKLTSCDYYIDVTSYFWKFTNPIDYLSLMQELSLLVIIH